MGLPRYLKDQHKSGNYIGHSKEKILFHGIGENYNRMRFAYGKITYEHTINCNLKYGLKLAYGAKIKDCFGPYVYADEFKKDEIRWFHSWEKRNGRWVMLYKRLTVNRYFIVKARELSNQRMALEKELIDKKEEIDSMRNVEQGRLFKGRLRHMVLERDNFKCVLCGRGVPNGVSLEVDHIIAWVDGGKTVYDNGQTICSECNKGKHHAKKFNNKVKEFKRAASE